MDVIDELLNPGTVPPEKLAELLREQNRFGTVAALSGSKALAPLGEKLRTEAVGTAAGLGENAETNSLNRWKSALLAAAKKAEIDARTREGGLNRQNRLDVAGMRSKSVLDAIAARKEGGGTLGIEGQIQAAQTALDRMADLADVARTAQDQSGVLSAGLLSATKIIPGTAARNLEEYIEPLRSEEALSKLNELRDAARAMGMKGSGLGQVTEREIRLLMGARRSLDTAQSERQLDAALKHLETQYRSSIRNIQRELDNLVNGVGVVGEESGLDAILNEELGGDFEDDDAY